MRIILVSVLFPLASHAMALNYTDMAVNNAPGNLSKVIVTGRIAVSAFPTSETVDCLNEKGEDAAPASALSQAVFSPDDFLNKIKGHGYSVQYRLPSTWLVSITYNGQEVAADSDGLISVMDSSGQYYWRVRTADYHACYAFNLGPNTLDFKMTLPAAEYGEQLSGKPASTLQVITSDSGVWNGTKILSVDDGRTTVQGTFPVLKNKCTISADKPLYDFGQLSMQGIVSGIHDFSVLPMTLSASCQWPTTLALTMESSSYLTESDAVGFPNNPNAQVSLFYDGMQVMHQNPGIISMSESNMDIPLTLHLQNSPGAVTLGAMGTYKSNAALSISYD